MNNEATTDRKEPSMTYRITTTYRPADNAGFRGGARLAHTELRCSCGLVWGTTMESQVSIEANQHLDYHERTGK